MLFRWLSDNQLANAGDAGLDPWAGKIPWRKKWQHTPEVLKGKSYGHRNLVHHKVSDRTE